MGFSSSVSLMVRLGVFFDVHSPLWVAVQLYYRQQRHGFGWVSAALGSAPMHCYLCDGAVYVRQTSVRILI
jgi:hypothetical protein